MSVGYSDVEMEALDKVTSDFSSLNMGSINTSQRDAYHNSYVGYGGQSFGYESSSSTYDYNSRNDSSLSLYNHDMLFGYDTQSSFSQGSLHSQGTRMEDFQKFQRDYELYYRSYMSWKQYCDHIEC